MAKNYKHNINSEISLTYITSGKKMTFVAALGVTIGVAIFVFMNSLAKGFDRSSEESIFKTVPHIRLYKDYQISKSLLPENHQQTTPLILNPKVVPQSPDILNPESLANTLRRQDGVSIVTKEVDVDFFINSSNTQLRGVGIGIEVAEANKMFNIASFVVEGNLKDLESYPNAIFLGVGMAQKLSLRTGDYIQINSSKGVSKSMRVVGLFKTNNSNVDKRQAYFGINTARQLLREDASYVSNIYINVKDFNKAKNYAKRFAKLTGYTVEDWETANETLLAATRMRRIVITFISSSILVIAAFGIYNILNMTITQKINEIAILKAMGFKGKDVIRIFVKQAVITGALGLGLGLILATFLIKALQQVYIGGDVGYFPVRFEPMVYLRGGIFGLVVTFLAGYIPARKAAHIDPVSIFRK